MLDWAIANPALPILGAAAAVVAIGVAIFKSGMWAGSVNTSLNSLKDAVFEIKESVGKIRDNINGLLYEITSRTLTPGSPLEPNELGQKVSESIDAPRNSKGPCPWPA